MEAHYASFAFQEHTTTTKQCSTLLAEKRQQSSNFYSSSAWLYTYTTRSCILGDAAWKKCRQGENDNKFAQFIFLSYDSSITMQYVKPRARGH